MPNEFLTAIVVAAITATGTIICQLLINRSNRDILLYRIGELEKKQDKYNNLQERTHNLETQVKINANDIKVANHRIEDLEKAVER